MPFDGKTQTEKRSAYFATDRVVLFQVKMDCSQKILPKLN